MKNKIKKVSKGDFQILKPEVVFPKTQIIMVIGEGEQYQGSFQILNQGEGKIRGLVYTSSYRITLTEQGFEGKEITVRYSYDGQGLVPGHVETGKFTVVCNGGEYDIFFAAFIEKPFLMTPYGKIQNMKDFRCLAVQDYLEANRLFRSMNFYEILKYEDPRVFSLYDNMRKWALNEQGLEEFLVGTKQKERLMLSLSEEETEVEYLSESKKNVFTIQKNTWGYIPITVSIKGDFLFVDKKEFSTDDFVGNIYSLEYIIYNKKLHGGKNYGEITVSTPYQTLVYHVSVMESRKAKKESWSETILLAKIIKGYLPCVSGKENINEWVKDALWQADQLRTEDAENEMYQLLQAHIYLRGNMEEEAKWILENFTYSRTLLSKAPETAAYYLYLTALLRKEGSHTRRVIEELDRLYLHNDDSWMIACMLATLSPEYKSYASRIAFYEEQYKKGAHAVLFYEESYLCYQENNSLLSNLGEFELQVVNFASKYHMVTKELALQIASLVNQMKGFNDRLYSILVQLYQEYEMPQILGAICTLLIKGNKIRTSDFKWYKMAVDQDLKIARLFEHYMMTIQEDRVREALPRAIYLYFLHGNLLDYKKEALLYANLLTYEEESSELLVQYRDQIEEFAWNQLAKRHINDRLRVIYKQFFNEKNMTAEQITALNDICHSYEITTTAPGMKYVMVLDGTGKILAKTPYTEKGTIIFIYDGSSRIVWESVGGRHYADSIPYETKRLFYEPHFIEYCRHYLETIQTAQKEVEEHPLTMTALREQGMETFDENEVFRLCSRQIREQNYEEDDFVSQICHHLFRKGLYDKATLIYLTNYFCGATDDMKQLWETARDYEVNTSKLAERIVTQMVFADNLFNEEDVFEDYYKNGAYFRLKRAYLAYVSRQYVLKNRVLMKNIFADIYREFQQEEPLADICKIALLKYCAGQEDLGDMTDMLKKFMQELCQQHVIFPFYKLYSADWLNEMRIADKTLVAYHAKGEGKVRIRYQVTRAQQLEDLDFRTEVLTPVYANVYVKEFVLFGGETLNYYFEESTDTQPLISEKATIEKGKEDGQYGKYERLNAMTFMGRDERIIAMRQYEYEEDLAKQLFFTY